MTANPLDFFSYKEDYPNIRKYISIQNYKQNNVIFFDVNSAVKKSVILKYPYPENVPVSEDLGWAIGIIKKNYKLIYEPTATVIHSHKFSLIIASSKASESFGFIIILQLFSLTSSATPRMSVEIILLLFG